LVVATEAATQPSVPVPPLAAQVVALVADHLKVNEPPGWMLALVEPFTVNDTTGAPGGAGLTVRVAVPGAPVPPGPVQVSV
jgi:hypothetical protein